MHLAYYRPALRNAWAAWDRTAVNGTAVLLVAQADPYRGFALLLMHRSLGVPWAMWSSVLLPSWKVSWVI